MTQIRWEKMSERDIRKLISEGEREMSRRTATKKKDAKQKLAAVAREFGFKLDELLGAAGGVATRTRGAALKEPKEPKAKLPPKYCNPADAAQTWSGHGKRPAWANAHLQAGGDLSDLLIRKGRAPRATAAAAEKATRSTKAKPAVRRAPRKAKAA